jgi:hypothetical protein
MKALCPPPNAPDKDLVMTPPDLAIEIINHFKPTGVILDPCRGDGAFYNNLPPATRDWCELNEGRDFFDYNQQVDWIITNPPWSKMATFLSHGMQIADNIVYLTTINHYTTKKRIREMNASGFAIKEIYCVPTPKTNWPQMGFQLGAIHTKRNYTGLIQMSYSPSLCL